MDTTRRTLLRGMAAAPFAAAAGGLLVPETAYAAAPPKATVVMKGGVDGFLPWADASDRLRSTWTAATLAQVLTTATQQGTVVGDWDDREGAKNTVPEPFGFRYGFGWDGGRRAPDKTWDRRSNWYPQGITTTYDGYGEPLEGRSVVAVSWYAKGDGFEDRGARVSFVDVTGGPASPRYQHVLLVEPVQSSKAGAKPSFRPVSIHAGGMAWAGNFLYIANRPGETTHVRRGGMSVFDVSKLIKVTGRGKERAYGYDYLLPLHHIYENARGSRLLHSQLSLDRTRSTGVSLVVSEFRESTAQGVAARWEVDDRTGYIKRGEADESWWLGTRYVQGAVSVGEDAYYSANDRSAPGKLQGNLWRHKGRTGGPAFLGKLSKGPEDLSYEPVDGRSLWALGEHKHLRRVYRVRV
ncbi:hypothetical protein [Streptomyces sp. NPDC003036]|uniref:hypothetical protein n=1 Tax=Streptomyces sp. NPDC003036 TaxID=3154442 RepID=UPI00339ECCBF